MGKQKFKRQVLSQAHTWPDDRGVIQGIWDYDNAAAAQDFVSGDWVALSNSGLGPQTFTEMAFPYAPNVYNAETGQFDFSDLQIGDTLDLRVSATVNTANNNQAVKLSLFLGMGVFEYELPVMLEQGFKQQGTHTIGASIPLCIGNALPRDNPAELRAWSDSTGTIQVDGWFVRAFSVRRR